MKEIFYNIACLQMNLYSSTAPRFLSELSVSERPTAHTPNWNIWPQFDLVLLICLG
jgi:hypothetical protein